MQIKRELLEISRQASSPRRDGHLYRETLGGIYIVGSEMMTTDGRALVHVDLPDIKADGVRTLLPEEEAKKILSYAKKGTHVHLDRTEQGLLQGRGAQGPGSFVCGLEEGTAEDFPATVCREHLDKGDSRVDMEVDLRRLTSLLNTLLKAIGETDRRGPNQAEIPAKISISKSRRDKAQDLVVNLESPEGADLTALLRGMVR